MSDEKTPTLFDVQEMELNFGPQHPSTHGVLRLVLRVDGEKILDAKPDVGYLHRGTEKLFETETYPMGIPHRAGEGGESESDPASSDVGVGRR